MEWKEESGNVITGGSVAPGEYKLKLVVSTVDLKFRWDIITLQQLVLRI